MTFTCPTCGRTAKQLGQKWSVRCCGLTHSFGLNESEQSIKSDVSRKPCVYLGKSIGTFDCDCGSVDVVYQCDLLKQPCLQAKPNRLGTIKGVDVALSEVAFCVECTHYETDWSRRLVQWIAPPRMDIKPTSTRCVVTVAIGREWRRILRIAEPTMRRYASRIGADFVAITNKTQQWSPLEKFRCRELLEHYESILFVDADVLIASDAPNLDTSGVAMHDDCDLLPDHDWIKAEWKQLAESQNVDPEWRGRCFNSGVICCDREHRDLFTPPSKPFYATHCAEQFWIEFNAMRFGFDICDLQWRWNAQYWHRDWKSKLRSSHFVHLANAPNRLQAVKEAAAIVG